MEEIESSTTFWKIEDFINENPSSSMNYALLVLNQPIISKPSLVTSLWNNACLRVTVDGGSDRWLTFCQNSGLSLVPDMITGDFDSAKKETLEFFAKAGSKIIETPDQDETDFTKALRETSSWFSQNKTKPDAVISLVETSGRIDQIMANINTLFKSKNILHCPVYQLASNSISWLLQEGHHKILIPSQYNNKTCSLVPVGSPAKHVTSTGLKWNLDGQEMRFGALVSTSNRIAPASDNLVTVTTDSALLWSIEID
ncbi:thiamin pyrophosphokinase 1 [Cloeon dipterum]|uniref:thiamin pyrophosphokinase 1 n=1 Tax=Cloeon dipterum TaxID=197152 RepID=UPI0032207290